jgi:hypothetical protein
VTDQRPSTELALGMFFIVLAMAVVAAIFYVRTDPNLHLDLESFVVFAPIYAAAQAIERLLEPFAAILLPAQAEKEDADAAKAGKQRAQGALEASLQANPGAAGQGVAVVAAQDELAEADAQQRDAAARLSKRQSERALVFFAIASVASLALCAVLGLGLIQAMTDDPLEEYLRAIDVALTGIVIGAGTKPLHDLISRVEKAKEKAATSV